MTHAATPTFTLTLPPQYSCGPGRLGQLVNNDSAEEIAGTYLRDDILVKVDSFALVKSLGNRATMVRYLHHRIILQPAVGL